MSEVFLFFVQKKQKKCLLFLHDSYYKKAQIRLALKGKTMTNEMSTLNSDSIIPELKASNVKSVFQKLSTHVHRLIGTPERFILGHLLEQEKRENSGIGNGVAIAHMRLPRLTHPMIIYSKLSQSVDFNANDGEPVDLLCLILSPDHEGSVHLQRLAKVTRFFRDISFCDKLRTATDKDEIRQILKEINYHKLAA